MVLDLAQPVALLLSILSLYSVFHAAFLANAPVEDRIHHALLRLALAAGICLVSGLLFRERERQLAAQFRARFDADFTTSFWDQPAATPIVLSLRKTLPVRLFCWATALMLILFAVSWYLETYCEFSGHVHY